MWYPLYVLKHNIPSLLKTIVYRCKTFLSLELPKGVISWGRIRSQRLTPINYLTAIPWYRLQYISLPYFSCFSSIRQTKLSIITHLSSNCSIRFIIFSDEIATPNLIFITSFLTYAKLHRLVLDGFDCRSSMFRPCYGVSHFFQ